MTIELTRQQAISILKLLDDLIYSDPIRMTSSDAYALHSFFQTPLADELRAEFLAKKEAPQMTLTASEWQTLRTELTRRYEELAEKSKLLTEAVNQINPFYGSDYLAATKKAAAAVRKERELRDLIIKIFSSEEVAQ